MTDNPANAVGMERTQRAIETGQPQPPYELQLRTQKGRMIWVEVHEAPVVKDGRTAAIVGSLTDITDRRQAETALRESQYFLAKAQEVAGVGCYEFQANTGHWISTPMLDQIFGLTTDDPKDIASWLRVIHPDERAEMQRYLMEQVLQTGQRFEKEYRIVRASDGEERWVFGLGELEFDTSGRAVKMIGTIQDITDRKRAEKALQESERKYRELVENANSIILRWNPRGEITFLNEFGLAFFGYSASEILGRHVIGTLVPENESTGRDLRPLMDQICNAPRSFERNVNENTRRDGTRAWVAWTNRAVFDARGELVEVFSVGSDVTDRKQAEQEIRRLNSELEQRVADRTIQLSAANRELEAFSYSVSHDLRAPLRAINGFSQALQEDCAAQLDENGREYLDRVRAATRRMEQLIDDLLKLSRVTRASLRPSPVDLSALARTTLADLQAAHPERVVETVVEPGLEIEADPGLMRVVLDNLLGNAWKFTRDRSPGRIEVGRCEREGRPACFIRDNGVGFDMQYSGKLFGAFQRLHTTEQFEGTGIGLATVQRILHRHGSQAWAEGNLGQGATFYFTLDTVGC